MSRLSSQVLELSRTVPLISPHYVIEFYLSQSTQSVFSVHNFEKGFSQTIPLPIAQLSSLFTPLVPPIPLGSMIHPGQLSLLPYFPSISSRSFSRTARPLLPVWLANSAQCLAQISPLFRHFVPQLHIDFNSAAFLTYRWTVREPFSISYLIWRSSAQGRLSISCRTMRAHFRECE